VAPAPAIVATVDAATAVPEPSDPTEPVAPASECNVTRRPVYCRGGFPVRKANQPPPFADCPRTLAGERDALGTTGKLFSAVETGKARAAGTGECCYLEWTWTACL
jgi:hypothetical protein